MRESYTLETGQHTPLKDFLVTYVAQIQSMEPTTGINVPRIQPELQNKCVQTSEFFKMVLWREVILLSCSLE